MEPWKTSVMMRVLVIPVNHKNYLISLLDIGFWVYFWPSVIHYWIYFSLYIVLGVTITDIQKIIDGDFPSEDKFSLVMYITCIIMLLIASITIIIYLIVFTVKAYKAAKREQREMLIE